MKRGIIALSLLATALLMACDTAVEEEQSILISEGPQDRVYASGRYLCHGCRRR